MSACLCCFSSIDESSKSCSACGTAVSNFARSYRDHPLNGTYEIIKFIGLGGMGEVYKLRHLFFDAFRVIKVMRPEFVGNAKFRNRFLREVKAAISVEDKSVARIYEASPLPDGSLFTVWEFIDGINLLHVLKQAGQLEPTRAIGLTTQVLDGLSAIHASGLVHRDVSPDNVMVSTDASGRESARVIDFGVAKNLAATTQLTELGLFVGKPAYASPEQFGSAEETIDARSDLYSVGVMLYQMLTGSLPFDGPSSSEFRLQHLQETPRPLRGLPEPARRLLQPIIQRAMQKDRALRFSSASEFRDALALQTEAIRQPVIETPDIATTESALTSPEPAFAMTKVPRGILSRRPRTYAALVAILLAAVVVLATIYGFERRSRASSPAIVAPIVVTASSMPAYWVDYPTRLMWTIRDNGNDIAWEGAREYCRALTLGGFSEWRLPTIDELAPMYYANSKRLYRTREPLTLSDCCVWSGTEAGDGTEVKYFNFIEDQRLTFRPSGFHGYRALCVRVVNTQTEAEAEAEARNVSAEVQKQLGSFKKVNFVAKRPDVDYKSEVTAWSDTSGVRKLEVTDRFESGDVVTGYLYANGVLVFVYQANKFFNKAGMQVTLDEEREYFRDNKMLKWLRGLEKAVNNPSSAEFAREANMRLAASAFYVNATSQVHPPSAKRHS